MPRWVWIPLVLALLHILAYCIADEGTAEEGRARWLAFLWLGVAFLVYGVAFVVFR